MTAATLERPAAKRPKGGGVPARRAVIRWAIRLLRREWRQQLLILALITVAVGATFIASAVATTTPASPAGVLGNAQFAVAYSGSPSQRRPGHRRRSAALRAGRRHREPAGERARLGADV